MDRLHEVTESRSSEELRLDYPSGLKEIETRRLSQLVLVFAVLSFIFFILLVFFRAEFHLYPLVSYQDVLDILTPLVLIPIYWLLFRYSSRAIANLREEITFMVLASLWVMGHGIHLAANSIDNLISNEARSASINIAVTMAFRLVYFYDEILSHYLWHMGVVGLAVLLIYREWRKPAGEKTFWQYVVPAGIIYGFTCFAFFLEGQTLLLGLPFTLLLVIFTCVWGRKKLKEQPLLAFYFLSSLIALLLFAGWSLYWGGLPQFSETGLI